MRKDVRHHSFGPQRASLAEPLSQDAFKAEVRGWADRLGVNPAEIHLVDMSRKWASCSAKGRVTFDVELLVQPEEFRREVIVHELLHLKVPNHGPLFRALLAAHLNGGS